MRRNYSRDSIQILYHPVAKHSRIIQDLGHRSILPGADFQRQQAARAEMRFRAGCDLAEEIETVAPPVEGEMRLEIANVCIERRSLSFDDIRRIGNDQVELAERFSGFYGIKKIPFDESDSRCNFISLSVAMGDGQRRHGNIGSYDFSFWCIRSDRYRDRARSTLWSVLRAIADWWDSVELWITQLAFPFQVVLAIVVLLPLCAGVAVLADRVSDAVDFWTARWHSTRDDRPGT